MAEWNLSERNSYSTNSVARIGDRLYAYNGTNPSAITHYADLENKTFADIRINVGLGQAGQEAYSVGYERKIYFLDAPYSRSDYCDLVSLDVDTGEVRKLTQVSISTRFGLTVHNGIIYILGGLIYDYGAVDWVRAYDINDNRLYSLQPMPRKRTNFKPVVNNDKIYCIGGQLISGSVTEVGSQVDVYDIGLDRWETVQSCNTPRFDAPTTSSGKYIYLIGGRTGTDKYSDVLSVEVYDTETDSWAYGDSLPQAFFTGHPAIATVYNNYIYLYPATRIEENSRIFSYLLYYNLSTLAIANPFPAAGFINEKTDNTFRWSLDPPTSIQASAEFQWRVKGAAEINSIFLTSEQQVTIPANTFQNTELEWRVRATDTNGVESDWSAWFQLTTIDVPHSKPTGLLPNGGVRNGTKPIQFTWIVHASNGSEQTAFELQSSEDGQTWSDLSGKVYSKDRSYTISELERGTLIWRVRTYNTDDDPSPWSDQASFVVRTAPPPPQWVGITPSQSRPLASWVFEEQIAWRMQINRGEEMVYDTGIRLGNDTSHKIGVYLPNGQYTFRLQVMNELSLWSEWAELPATISFLVHLIINAFEKEAEFGARVGFDVEVRP